MTICQGVGDQVVVGHLQKGIDGCRFILLLRGPGAHGGELRRDRRTGLHEQAVAVVTYPVRQLIAACGDFIGNLVVAEHATCGMVVEQPLPKGRAEIQPVVQVLGLDEHVGIKQVGHSITPSSRAA